MTVCARHVCRGPEGLRSPGAGVAGVHELLGVAAGHCLEEQQVLLTIEPCLSTKTVLTYKQLLCFPQVAGVVSNSLCLSHE